MAPTLCIKALADKPPVAPTLPVAATSRIVHSQGRGYLRYRFAGRDNLLSEHLNLGKTGCMAERAQSTIRLAVYVALAGVLLGRQANAAAVSGEVDPSLSSVRLSGDVRVELLGVGLLSDEKGAWWRPDGSALAGPPYASVSYAAGDGKGRHVFAVKVTSGQGVSIRYEFSDHRVGAWQGQSQDSSGKIIRDQYVIIARLPQDHGRPLEQLDLSIGVNIHPARVLVCYDAKRTLPIRYADGGVVFHTPHEEDGNLVVTAAHTDHHPYRETWFVAYDRQGKMYRANARTSAKTSGFVSARCVFNGLTRAKLDRIEMRGRSFEWAVFKNVSLVRGRRTQVQTEARLNPDDRVGEVAVAPSSTAHLIGLTMRSFELPGADGARYRLADFKGKAVLINVFATWCGPCQGELAQLAKLRKDHGRDELSIVTISKKERAAVVREYAHERPLPIPILVDETGEVTRHLADQQGSVPVPTNVLLDRDRKIVYAGRGFTEQEWKKLCEALDSLLGIQEGKGGGS